MNKSKFLNLLRDPTHIKPKALNALEEMTAAYPYCQAIHILIAKANRQSPHEDFEKKLNHAAVYTANRKHLKNLIEDNFTRRTASKIIEGEKQEDETEALSSDFLIKEIEAYLEKLRKEKVALELQEEEGLSEELRREKQIFKNELEVKIAEAEAKLAPLVAAPPAPETKESEERREELYNELEENLKSLQIHKDNAASYSGEILSEKEESSPRESFTPLSNNVEKERMEEYLASLKASEQQEIEDEKLREQFRIINNFIENEPKLSRLERGEDKRYKPVDLSLKSLQVDENMASENLALIMAKQGKIEKAEEIYNKLIWKFPEKKAYFVARIEELKNK